MAAAVLAALAVAWAAYARPPVPLTPVQRAGLRALRVATLLAVVLVLLDPVRTVPVPPVGGVVAVLVDRSASMGIADTGGVTRIERAATLVGDQLVPLLAPEFDVRMLTFGDTVTVAPVEGIVADAPRTDLAAALAAVADRIDGRPVVAVVVVSDGGETGPDVALDVAGRAPAPIYTIGVGASTPGPDREVAGLVAGEAGAAGSVVELGATLVSHRYGVDPFDIRLIEDGRLLEVRRVQPVRDSAPIVETFRVSPDPTVATVYAVEVPVDPTELVGRNNRRSILVRPPARPRRILLVEGAPGHEHGFLKRAWLADPGVTLDAVVRKGRNDRGEQTFYVQGDPARTAALGNGYPPDRESLFLYDVVVLANVEGAFFQPEQLERTAAFVAERGGGLLLLGPESLRRLGYAESALAPVLPATLVERLGLADGGEPGSDGQRMRVTDAGARHPIMQLGGSLDETRARWPDVPALAGSVHVGPIRPGAAVLAVATAPSASGAARPLVVVQRYGAGRSMIFAGRAAWRWRMRLPAADRVYETFWGQVVRWLSGGATDPVAIATRGGESAVEAVVIDVRVRDTAYRAHGDAEVTLRVSGPTGAPEAVDTSPVDGAAGLHRATFRASRPGVYRVDARVTRAGEPLGVADDWFLVGGGEPEFADPWLNAGVLRRVAEASGGTHLEADRLAALAPAIRAAARPERRTTTRALWHHVAWFGLLVALLGTEWSLRRAWGMR